MKTLKDFQNDVFVINYKNEIEKMTYQDYLNDFWSDGCTSPRGNENRIQDAAVIVGRNGEVVEFSLNNRADLLPNEEEGESLMWSLYDWGTGGNHGRLLNDRYESEEEVEVAILEGKEYDFNNGNTNNPIPYDTIEEAQEQLDEILKDLENGN